MSTDGTNKNTQAGTDEVYGRIPKEGEHSPMESSRDISRIDRQEGEMNNGTIGRDWEHSNDTNKKDENDR